MLRTLNLIPLRVIPYSDRNSILSAYSRELGRVSFVVPAGAGREARRRRALLMPMRYINMRRMKESVRWHCGPVIHRWR